MKSIKHATLLLAGSFAATLSFAQVNVGVTNSTNAAVQKSVGAGAATQATTKAAAKATTTTTAATKSTVSAATTKAAEVKTTTAAMTHAAADKAKQNTDVNANARVNAQAETHASEKAKAHANENSAVFGTKADGSVQMGANADVKVEGSKAIDATDKKRCSSKIKGPNNNRRYGFYSKRKSRRCKDQG